MRTQSEIEQERYALKALRGDFAQTERTGAGDGASQVLTAVRG